MKKQSKQTLMALFIILIFGMSSVAFVFSGSTPEEQAQPLTSFVMNKEPNPQIENTYIQNGFTFLRFYNDGSDPYMTSFIEQAPDSFTTPNGQKQLYVIKLPGNDSYISISNINGFNNIYNLTQEKLYDELCKSLMVMPTECALNSLNLTS